ncbi:UDP-glucuronosyltransferase 1A1-like [Ciconia boyciana]|uniref:UDP-glucuronosyltransferase 1A1-like n=1 Tax=Ciconia boyciana TaxID=52775 RepID=UPI003BA2BB71
MAPVLRAHLQVTAALALLLSVLSLAAGGKLLVVQVDGSPWFSMREVLDSLKQRGHEIVVIAPEINLHIKPTKDFVMKMYPVPFTQEKMDENFRAFLQDVLEEGSFLERFLKVYQSMKRVSDLVVSSCEHLLYNKELVRYLEDSKFDAVLTDPVLPCGLILAEHLSVPSVVFLRGIPCGLDFEATQCPNPPSYVPRIFTEHTDRMNFLQRVKNLIFDIPNYFLCDFVFQPYAKLASGFLQRDVTVLDLLRQASIWLVRSDFVLDYPRPLMPNIIFIGGVNCAHKKLPQASRRFCLGDAYVRSENKVNLNEREGATVAWQNLLKSSRAAKAFLVETVTAALALLLSVLSLAAGGKLLVVPVDGSRWLSMREVLDSLRIFTKHTDPMNFLQRVKNLIFDIPNYFLCEFLFQPYTKMASEFLQRDVTVPDLLRKASIWLLRLDFVFHYPRPLMPNMIVIGGVNCAHKKLTQENNQFPMADSSIDLLWQQESMATFAL